MGQRRLPRHQKVLPRVQTHTVQGMTAPVLQSWIHLERDREFWLPGMAAGTRVVHIPAIICSNIYIRMQYIHMPLDTLLEY